MAVSPQAYMQIAKIEGTLDEGGTAESNLYWSGVALERMAKRLEGRCWAHCQRLAAGG